MFNLFNRTESCLSDRSFVFLLFDTFCMYLILMAIVILVFYSLSMLVHGLKESRNILSKYTYRNNYKFKSYIQLCNAIMPIMGNRQT